MQIEIDFDVFKELTARRVSETDGYNAVIRRLLELPEKGADGDTRPQTNAQALGHGGVLAAYARKPVTQQNALANTLGGAWFDNIHFPEGTQFRVSYKGQAYSAEIQGARWVGADGIARTSPSAAAGAISNTNVNGWRFWYVRWPGEEEWVRMDQLKQ